jgi:hypothetical protein
MGVFRVRDTVSGTALIGSSVDLPSMLNRQRFQLEMGVHPDKALQRAWDASSPEAFVFEVLDELEASDVPGHEPGDDLRELERLWRERLSGPKAGERA